MELPRYARLELERRWLVVAERLPELGPITTLYLTETEHAALARRARPARDSPDAGRDARDL
jgi:hypothetical protein